MILLIPDEANPLSSIPRMSGDDPTMTPPERLLLLYSPHERG